MPASSSSKKLLADAGAAKKPDVTPLRISSRVRKEKFSVKELFGGARDRDLSSDEEPLKPTPKKRLVEKTSGAASKGQGDSKVQVVRVEVVKASTSKQASKLLTDSPSTKAGTSKASNLQRVAPSTGKLNAASAKSAVPSSPKPNVASIAKSASLGKSNVPASLKVGPSLPKSSALQGKSATSTKPSVPVTAKSLSPIPAKTSLLKKQHESSNNLIATTSLFKDDKEDVNIPKSKIKNKDDEKFDPLKLDGTSIEPLFNEDNIDTVLENPSSLGLDIVVTKLTESDQKEQTESKKSKNIVTIAKVAGSAPVSKPMKVVPMKPNDKISDIDPLIEESKISKSLEFKGSSVVTPKIDKNSKSSASDKKSNTKLQARSAMTGTKSIGSNQIKEVKVNKSLGSDVVVVTQTIDNKGTISTKVVEKKRDLKLADPKTKSKLLSIDSELDKCKDQLEITFSDKTKSKDYQRQKAIKRSILDMSDYKTNGLKSVKVKSVEADSSSNEIEIKKAKVVEEIFGENEDASHKQTKKAPYEFDRYFTTSESIIEHNESLDSEGSNEDSETYLSHFYEKENYNNIYKKRKSDSCSDGYTIYDLMYEVNCEFPSWNLHVMQDTTSFLICQVTRGQHGLPTMNKMIELESDFSSAKVYINQILHREFCGSYNSYESIKELITNVQNL